MIIIDRKDKDCKICGEGRYIETEFFDDMDGVLHCSVCNAQVVRHVILTDEERLKIVIDLLKKIVGPYTYEDDINCIDDVLILARKALDEIGETW
jgi:CRISPR/Cas system-associated protein Cas10 (large subunit of type III CRISPR-Cas system)